MEDYIERVMRVAAERRGEPVFNGSIDHARVIATAMFKHAKKSVDIFSGELNARVYGPDNVLDEAEFFLTNTDHKVRILLERMPDGSETNHPFFKRFMKRENLSVKLLPSFASERIPFHLMVADQDSYRFEEDKKNVAAIAAWGDKSGGQHLSSIFDKLWNIGADRNPSSSMHLVEAAG
jgi:hypothetical protein